MQNRLEDVMLARRPEPFGHCSTLKEARRPRPRFTSRDKPHRLSTF